MTTDFEDLSSSSSPNSYTPQQPPQGYSSSTYQPQIDEDFSNSDKHSGQILTTLPLWQDFRIICPVANFLTAIWLYLNFFFRDFVGIILLGMIGTALFIPSIIMALKVFLSFPIWSQLDRKVILPAPSSQQQNLRRSYLCSVVGHFFIFIQYFFCLVGQPNVPIWVSILSIVAQFIALFLTFKNGEGIKRSIFLADLNTNRTLAELQMSSSSSSSSPTPMNHSASTYTPQQSYVSQPTQYLPQIDEQSPLPYELEQPPLQYEPEQPYSGSTKQYPQPYQNYPQNYDDSYAQPPSEPPKGL